MNRLVFLLVLVPVLALAQAPAEAGHDPMHPDPQGPLKAPDGGVAEPENGSDTVGFYVIGKDMEPVITDMLGGSDTLPGGCKLDAAHVWRTNIRIRWNCGETTIKGLLEHPSAAPANAAVRTEQFAVSAQGDAPWPAGFAEALKARLAEKGGKFTWLQTHPNEPVAPGTFKAEPIPEGTYPDGATKPPGVADDHGLPVTKRKIPVTFVVLGVLLVAVVAWQIWKRRQGPAEPQPPANTPDSPPPASGSEPPKDGA